MKMKKTLALLSALTLMCGFTACGDEGDKESSATTTSSTTTTTSTTSTTTTTTTTTAPVKLEVDPNAITFDTESFYTGHCMAESNYTNDEAECDLSIAEINGDKKLRVQVLSKKEDGSYKVPKIVFNLAELIGAENTGKIGQISVDFTCKAEGVWVNDDGTESKVVGNFLGAIAGNIAEEKGVDADGITTQNTWATHYEFSLNDWENEEQTWRVDAKVPALLAVNGYADNYEGATLVIMRWSQLNQVDFYIDNITIYDKDGKSMPIIYDGAANPAGEGTPAETTAAAE
ncbi:MAG: hypothetical protein ACI4J3_08575 [Oscillospiraceae bacterium]